MLIINSYNFKKCCRAVAGVAGVAGVAVAGSIGKLVFNCAINLFFKIVLSWLLVLSLL